MLCRGTALTAKAEADPIGFYRKQSNARPAAHSKGELPINHLRLFKNCRRHNAREYAWRGLAERDRPDD
jgi:hypothetical protein